MSRTGLNGPDAMPIPRPSLDHGTGSSNNGQPIMSYTTPIHSSISEHQQLHLTELHHQQQQQQRQHQHHHHHAYQSHASLLTPPNAHLILNNDIALNTPPQSQFPRQDPADAHQQMQQLLHCRPAQPQSIYINEDMIATDDPHSPGLDGFPSKADYVVLQNGYIESLSPKKRDKALLTQERYETIRQIMLNPKCTTVGTAQFRFWVKRMFKLVFDHPAANGNTPVVVHEDRPVAVRESLYKVLTTAHALVQHGGRDKTSAEVRRNYSWVPKELIARFVRTCPTCVIKRNPGGRNSGRPMRRAEQKQRREEIRRQRIQEAEQRARLNHSPPPPAPMQQQDLPHHHPLHLALGGGGGGGVGAHDMHTTMYPMQAPTPPSSTASASSPTEQHYADDTPYRRASAPLLLPYCSAPEAAMMAMSAPSHDSLLARHYPVVYAHQQPDDGLGMVSFPSEYAFDPRGMYASGPGVQ